MPPETNMSFLEDLRYTVHLIILFAIGVLYFSPCWVAKKMHHKRPHMITNLLLLNLISIAAGWTWVALGWSVSLVWAFFGQSEGTSIEEVQHNIDL